ncbi:hypothetical protein TNCV_576611 [Trichonephila clavipes]|nr:hypothetical protein TNCV_576611 [Trichonephila clavipes]
MKSSALSGTLGSNGRGARIRSRPPPSSEHGGILFLVYIWRHVADVARRRPCRVFHAMVEPSSHDCVLTVSGLCRVMGSSPSAIKEPPRRGADES